jgi:hypothetical protein
VYYIPGYELVPIKSRNIIDMIIPKTIAIAHHNRLALAQFALLGWVLLLKAHTNSMTMFTMGIIINSIVNIQSPTVIGLYGVTGVSIFTSMGLD